MVSPERILVAEATAPKVSLHELDSVDIPTINLAVLVSLP